MTIGNTILFSPGEYGPNTIPGIALIAHELAHVSQYKAAGGIGPFLTQYFTEFKDNIIKQVPTLGSANFPTLPGTGTVLDTYGIQALQFINFVDGLKKEYPNLNLDTAYAAISFEVAAFEFGKDMRRYIIEIGSNPCP